MATLGRSRFVLPPLLAAFAAVLLLFVLLTVVLRFEGGFISRVTAPLVRLGSGGHDRVARLWVALFEGDRLREENLALREQLLQRQLRSAQFEVETNLQLLATHAPTSLGEGIAELLTVPVLAQPGSDGVEILWLDGGESLLIESGMAVLGPEGIIGLVESVKGEVSRVRLLTDRRSALGVEVRDRGELGVVRGNGDGRLELAFTRTATACEAGDPVVTSGLAGSLAPALLPVGVVESVSRNAKGEPVALVKLPTAPHELRTVWVLPAQRVALP